MSARQARLADRAPEDARRATPGRPHQRVVDEGDAQVGVDQRDRVGGVLDEGAEGGAAGAQAQLGVLAGGDVGGHHGHAARRRPPRRRPAPGAGAASAGPRWWASPARSGARRPRPPRPAARARGDRPPRGGRPGLAGGAPHERLGREARPWRARPRWPRTWRRSRSSSRTMLSSSPGPARRPPCPHPRHRSRRPPDPRTVLVTSCRSRASRARYGARRLGESGGSLRTAARAGSGSSVEEVDVLRPRRSRLAADRRWRSNAPAEPPEGRQDDVPEGDRRPDHDRVEGPPDGAELLAASPSSALGALAGLEEHVGRAGLALDGDGGVDRPACELRSGSRPTPSAARRAALSRHRDDARMTIRCQPRSSVRTGSSASTRRHEPHDAHGEGAPAPRGVLVLGAEGDRAHTPTACPASMVTGPSLPSIFTPPASERTQPTPWMQMPPATPPAAR